MYSRVSTGILHGIEGICVMVEADVSDGLPVFEMVGALGSEVKEGRERVRTALKNCGFLFPAKRITINITPAGIKKSGGGFDLPIAVSLLAAEGIIVDPRPDEVMIIGELGLDGSIHPVEGILPMVSGGMDAGKKICIVAQENYHEATLVPGITVVAAADISDVISYLNDDIIPNMGISVQAPSFSDTSNDRYFDFSDINGQAFVKRACEIAASGMHNLLLMGPPGAGKTFAARCIPSIMPSMTKKEQIELSKIYSVCGLFGEREKLLDKRPFRNPHHTISSAGLVGGGGGGGNGSIRPGEVSLASFGVLFLDELPEFRPTTLEILRQPLEDRVVNISRVSGDFTFPADFILVAAMNPCKCGYFPDRTRCQCSPHSVRNYLGRISQPLLDRIDLCVQTPEVTYEDLTGHEKNETSANIRQRVKRAHEIQQKRFKGKSYIFNSRIPASDIELFCHLGQEENAYMENRFNEYGLTARTYHRILKVARTIADLDEADNIGIKHLTEAFLYRSLDKKYWESML